MKPCPCCGADLKTTVHNGAEVAWCGVCCWPVTIKSLNDFLASGGTTDEDKAAIARFNAAMADLEEAVRAL